MDESALLHDPVTYANEPNLLNDLGCGALSKLPCK